MTDPIIDDVQGLLDKEFGDKKILEQILRAAKNNEVISNFERNYVRKLAEKHLGKKPSIEKTIEEPKTIPFINPEPVQLKTPQPFQTLSKPTTVSKSSPKNTKILLGVGLAFLAVIIIAAVSLSGNSDITSNIKTGQTPKQPTTTSYSIKTDQSSYSTGDIISISGTSKIPFGNKVDLSIKNSKGDLVWSEQINVKSNGEFTTLTFAGGPGWDNSGQYTIFAKSNSETTSNTFSFKK